MSSHGRSDGTFLALVAGRGDAAAVSAQTPDAGQQSFVTRCARCHGTDGNGGEFGPSITARVPTRTDADLDGALSGRAPDRGHAGDPEPRAQAEAAELIRYLRTLRPRNRSAAARREVTLTDGRRLAGLVQNQSLTDLQLLGDDRRIHLLRKSRRAVSRRHVAGRLAQLQRRHQRLSAQPDRADQHDATSRGWRRSGSSTCRTPRACRARRSWSTA